MGSCWHQSATRSLQGAWLGPLLALALLLLGGCAMTAPTPTAGEYGTQRGRSEVRWQPVEIELYRAIMAGQAAHVAELLDGGIAVDDPFPDGSTPAMAAVTNDASDVLQLLLSRGADPNARDRLGRTLLFMASSLSEPDVARVLLDAGADPNPPRDPIKGWTPLHEALKDWNLEVVELLLERGADPKVRAYSDQGIPTTLMSLSFFPDSCLYMKALLRAGADPNEQEPQGIPALWPHVYYDDVCVVHLLLRHGADPNLPDDFGRTSLHTAVEMGNLSMVQLLLSAGARGDIPSNMGVTPRQRAMEFGFDAIVQAIDSPPASLLDVGDDDETTVCRTEEEGTHTTQEGDSGAEDTEETCYLISPFKELWDNDPEGFVAALQQPGIRDRRYCRGSTWGMVAASTSLALLRTVIAQGGDMHQRGAKNKLPLHRAMGSDDDYAGILALLLEMGFDVNTPSEVGTLLHLAAGYGPEKVALLLDHGAEINARAPDGGTPLHHALHLKHPNKQTIRLLLERGARTDVRDNRGRTPLDVANSYGVAWFGRLLAERGRPTRPAGR